MNPHVYGRQDGTDNAGDDGDGHGNRGDGDGDGDGGYVNDFGDIYQLQSPYRILFTKAFFF